MFSGVTVTAVAAPLAIVSALLALILGRYGIAHAVRHGQGTDWRNFLLLSLGNVGLVVLFLVTVAQRVNRGLDPQLFSNLYSSSYTGCPTDPGQGPHPGCDPVLDPNPSVVMAMWAILFVALVWYIMSIVVIIAEMRAGRPLSRESRPHRL